MPDKEYLDDLKPVIGSVCEQCFLEYKNLNK